MTIRQGSLVLSLAGILSACGESGTRPSQFYTLSGVVTARTPGGPVSLARAQVTESRTRHTTTTGPDGSFVMNLIAMPPDNTVSVSKAGYVTATSIVTINGDTRVDIQLDPRPTYTLSGVISEITPTGLVPIEGVDLYEISWDTRTNGGDVVEGTATTDKNGFYSISGLWGMPDVENDVWLLKAGYRIDVQTIPPCDNCFRILHITGDTRLDIQLERLTSAGIARALRGGR